MKLRHWTLPEHGVHVQHSLQAARRPGCTVQGSTSPSSASRGTACQLSHRTGARQRSISRPAWETRSWNSYLTPTQKSQSRTAGAHRWRPLQRRHNTSRRAPSRVQSSLQEEVLLPLGLDFLTFLAATVIVIPVFKSVKASPVLGFLFSGLILGQLG